MNSTLYPTADDQLRQLVSKIAHMLPMLALLAGLAVIGVWAARWSGSAWLGLVAGNFAFVLIAAFFPVRPRDRR